MVFSAPNNTGTRCRMTKGLTAQIDGCKIDINRCVKKQFCDLKDGSTRCKKDGKLTEHHAQCHWNKNGACAKVNTLSIDSLDIGRVSKTETP